MMTDREQFEKWAEVEGYLLARIDDNHNSYEFDATRYAWYGFRASQEAQAKRIAEPTVAELNDEYLRDTHVEGLNKPTSREWQSLSDDQKNKIRYYSPTDLVNATEQKLRELNDA